MFSDQEKMLSNQTQEVEEMAVLQPQEHDIWEEEEDLDNDLVVTNVEVLEYNKIRVLENECSKVMFEEDLYMMDGQGKQMDQVTIAVEEGDQPWALNVYQYSQDESRMLRVQSEVFLDLQTSTELRRIKQQEQKKMLRITDNGSQYDVFRLCVDGSEGWRNKLHIPKEDKGFLFLEGANIVLLRKLAVSGLTGHIKGHTVNHDGELCDCEYEVDIDDQGYVCVRRTVSDSKAQEVMVTILSRKGRILSHQWSDSEWYLVTSIKSERVALQLALSHPSAHESPEEPTPLPKADVEAYFEKKEELLQMAKKYFDEHCDVQDMIADFMNKLLIEKPEDVIDFADTFFSEFVGINWSKNKSDTSDVSSDKYHVTSKMSYPSQVTRVEYKLDEDAYEDTTL